MIVENGPDQVCRSHDISMPQLEHMIRNSARYTHIWANRRYRDWIFDVDMEDLHVFKMARYRPPQISSFDGKVIDKP